ncbi:hypothetical protein HG530_004558 [Fusarium avenaceum]|nr:hypothetical protein HG530_004558 [Fusarium avenaceum]
MLFSSPLWRKLSMTTTVAVSLVARSKSNILKGAGCCLRDFVELGFKGFREACLDTSGALNSEVNHAAHAVCPGEYRAIANGHCKALDSARLTSGLDNGFTVNLEDILTTF